MNIGIDIDGVITNIDFLGILGKKKPILDKESSNIKVNNFLIRKILYKGIAFYSKHSKLRSDAAKASTEPCTSALMITLTVFNSPALRVLDAMSKKR